MPRVNIYIRQSDWDAWQAVADKPQLIHDALSDEPIPTKAEIAQLSVMDDGFRSDPKLTVFCKHNAAIGLCKYGCSK